MRTEKERELEFICKGSYLRTYVREVREECEGVGFHVKKRQEIKVYKRLWTMYEGRSRMRNDGRTSPTAKGVTGVYKDS